MHWGGALAPPLCLPHPSNGITASLEAESLPVRRGFPIGALCLRLFFSSFVLLSLSEAFQRG